MAVLTGAAHGIGVGIAQRCRALGMHVCISDVRQDPLAVAVAAIEAVEQTGKVAGFVCDVTDPKSVASLLEDCRNCFGTAPIQMLCSNAAAHCPKSTILSGTWQEWEDVYRVNVLGTRNTLSTFVPAMLAQPPEHRLAVEITASFEALMPGSVGPYGSSKKSVMSIAETLFMELFAARQADRANIVVLCPGMVATELWEQTPQLIRISEALTNKYGVTPLTVPCVVDRFFQDLSEGKFYSVISNGLDPTEAAEDRVARIRAGFPPRVLRTAVHDVTK